MASKKKAAKRSKKGMPRVFRGVFAVIIFSSMLLFISVFVKTLASLLKVEEGKHKADSSVEEVLAEDFVSAPVIDAKYAVMADSENDFTNLEKALARAKEEGVDGVIFLGDFTSWGDAESLTKAKKLLDASGLVYYSIPGDHDLAAAVTSGDDSGKSIYLGIFSSLRHLVISDAFTIVILDNSANFVPLSEDLVAWFLSHIAEADIVMFSQPLYHPTIGRSMGVIDGEDSVEVKTQADFLLDLIRRSNVRAVVAADLHMASTYADPVKPELQHILVGALTRERNMQSPQFSVLTLFKDGSFVLEEVLL